MSDDINNQILAIVTTIQIEQRANQTANEGIFRAMHGILQEILANLTAEGSGDLVAALRALTEAVNNLGSQVAAQPNIIVQRLKA